MSTDINLTNAIINQLTEAQLSSATKPANQFWLTEDEETDDTKANLDASNLSSSSITSWHTKLNDMVNPSAGTTQTGKQAVVVDSYLDSDGITWYRIWSDGWIECGGTYDYGSRVSDASFTITFPSVVFKNNNYNLQLSAWNNLGAPQNRDVMINCYYKATNQFKAGWFNSASGTAQYCDWYACGYGA